ncbi:germination protein [Clostridium polyendosporum]|uniref:Germination protein n=1 Tax=Clostridium polyendosporum TaxID=69208 RepID=A0A919S0Q5_9CLOT|nr:LysM peptidoglycan-binding domain-containing protein [Clostridium polyendosporum]GIM29982.1 germination protein [Clostridium polyendosporum]
MQIHVVQKDDTLLKISRFYGIDMSRIIEANQIQSPDLLVIGQALVIPTPAGTHMVRPRESLWLIAQKYRTSPQVIASDNNIANPLLIYPGQMLFMRRPVIEVNGYLSKTGTVGQQAVIKNSRYLSSVSIFSYYVKSDGSIVPSQIIANKYVSLMDDTEVIKITKSEHLVPIMVIANFVGNRFDSELVHIILSSSEVQNILISNILTTMKSKGYLGLNVDFEFIYPEDRHLFNQFIRQLVDRLHPEGYSVSIALAAKTSDTTSGILSGAQDYAVLGQLTDFVVIMTYDWGWVGGPPFPIAPINEVKKVIDYAVSVIPRDKILMGVPLYGYDWKLPFKEGETTAEMISSYEAVIRASTYRADIQYNYLYQSPFFLYTDKDGIKHEVWFEDARSVQVKYNLVKAYKLRGISYWEISFSFPQNWLVLNDVFRVSKLLR